MADQSTSTRPRRSAAVEAQVKVEESYQIWGQPPSDNEHKRGTPSRKRSATSESSAGRKRTRTSLQNHDWSGSQTVLLKPEPEGQTETQPVRRGSDRSMKNSVRRRTLVEFGEPSKKVTLRVPNSSAFKEVLRQMRETGGSGVRFAESHVGDLPVVFEAIADEEMANSTTQAKTPDETTNVRVSSVSTNISEPILPKLVAPSKRRSEYSLGYVKAQFLEILVDETRANTAGPLTETLAAGSSEEATTFGAVHLELEDAPSEPEAPRGDSNPAYWLEQLKAATSPREAQGLDTRSFVAAPPLIIDHTHPVLELSSSATQSLLHFAGNTRANDLIGSYTVGHQQHFMTALQPSEEDMTAINTLAVLVERLTLPEERMKISAELDKEMSTELRQTLDEYRIPPLLYHFRNKRTKAYRSQKGAAIIPDVGNNAGPSSAINEGERFSNQYTLKSLADPFSRTGRFFENQSAEVLYGAAPFSKVSSSDTQPLQVMHTGMSPLHRFTYEEQGRHKASPMSDFMNSTEVASDAKQINMQSPSPEPSGRRLSLASKVSRPGHEDDDDDSSSLVRNAIHATPNLISKLGISGSAFNEGFLQRRFVSVHPPPMNRQRPNVYFDRNPRGSSIGAHSFDPLVGLPDHSDPRTFHTPNSKDWPHVLAALQPSIDHFRQLSDGAEPLEMPLDSGYEVAHTLLQAHLHSWFVINRPAYAHNNAIPKLFKLERWEGGIEHWKFASNSPVRPTAPAHPQYRAPVMRLFPSCVECVRRNVDCSGFRESEGRHSKCSACSAGGEKFKCSKLPKSADFAPVLQNYPPCDGCARDNLYCHGFHKDIRNRCETCLRTGKVCSYDMAPFEERIRI